MAKFGIVDGRAGHSMAKAKRTNAWVVRRVVEELYAVDAASRAEAIEIASDSDGPFSVKVLKETAKISR
jgi:hypothetical protein